MATARPIHSWAETAKNVAEVVAIVVAGTWALWRFSYAEKPTLEPRGQISSTLDWLTAADPDHCLGRFGVTIKNIGVTAFEIQTLHLRVWLIDSPSSKSESITYMNPLDFQKGSTAFDQEVNAESLTGSYDPGVESHDDYVFAFPKSPPKLALFRVDAHRIARRAAQPEFDFVEFRWGDKCDIQDKK